MTDQPDELDLRSHDMAEDKRQELLRLFPEIRTEGGKIDIERLKLALGETVDVGKERYAMNWPGKADCFKTIQMPSLGTLRPCPEESVNFDTTENLIIEGDNLEVLKLLQKSYLGKIKMIYIDPPYNTGNDFIYPDNYSESLQTYLEYTGQVDVEGRKFGTNTDTDGRFHSKWLNMMYPRLYLARNLLRDDGVILISIDDHEVENLRRICNEVLGEENFVASMIWEKGRKNDAKLLSVGHEYVLVFAKSLGLLREISTIWREEKPGAREIWEKYLELRRLHDDNNSLIETNLQTWYSSLPKSHPSKKWSRYKRVDANGPWRDRDISWPGGEGPRYDVMHPKTKKPCKVPEAGWRFSTPEEMQRQIKLGLVEFREDHTEPPFRKAHIRPIPAEIEAEGVAEQDAAEDNGEEEFASQVRGSYFYKQSQVAVKFLRDLLGAKAFNNPKDHFELAKLFNYVMANDTNAMVMDFFAGSGSTGHAVMELNRADGGKRRYVLVQLPEPLNPDNKDQKIAAQYCNELGKPRTIAELTKERLRRAEKKMAEEEPMFERNAGFRVFKLAKSNLKVWDAEVPHENGALEKQLDLHVNHILEGRTAEDLLYELLLKSGFPLTTPVQKLSFDSESLKFSVQHEELKTESLKTEHSPAVYSVANGALFICLDRSLTLEQIRAMAEKKPERVVCLDEGFANNDQLKANAVQIFKTKGVTSFKTV